MTTSSIILGILFVICLAAPVATRSVGLMSADDQPSQKWKISCMFALSQGLAAGIGYTLGRLFSHLFTYIADYMVFVMMLVVAVKMFVDSMRILKGKMLYTVNKELDIFLLSIMAAMNTFLMSLMGPHFMPFGYWFFLIVILAGFVWSFFTVRIEFKPEMIKKLSFIEFSASVFMVVIAVLYLFTDMI